MKPNILTTHITTFQDRTWGRVFLCFEKNGEQFYIFKNWLKFEEFNFIGNGSLEQESAFSWFLEVNRFEFTVEEVQNGKADQLVLTPANHKQMYGTPSRILKRLILDLLANNAEAVQNRRGWYERSFKPEIVLSSLVVSKEKQEILLPEYEIEIRLEPIQKTIYLFFLKNLEGYTRITISEKKAELMEIYRNINQTADWDKIEKRMDDLVSLGKNNLNEKISKINKYLVDLLGERIAAPYKITGQKNENYKINLPSELINFE